uniref:Cytochrome c oxidase subunit 2 n=1 Tax=Dimorphostylis asiatica TaxID=2840398 RepID=A0A8F8FE41_9CRUS|nr:cytochrome c oxidase subunit II [Dimorphostylis asiatica]
MPTWNNLNLQEANSPLMEQIIYFHDFITMILSGILTLVAYIMMSMYWNKYISRNLLESHTMEVVWTVLPAIILVFIAMPSLRLLYLLDEVYSPEISLKTVGHQWYWSYEYSDFKNAEFDSYMIQDKKLRLLEVDNRTILPFNSHIRILVTSSDVIHSWTVPSLGVKVDAIPGRLNQLNLIMNRPGIFFGQCSEICGAQHSFMPIVVESTSMKFFLEWIKSL